MSTPLDTIDALLTALRAQLAGRRAEAEGRVARIHAAADAYLHAVEAELVAEVARRQGPRHRDGLVAYQELERDAGAGGRPGGERREYPLLLGDLPGGARVVRLDVHRNAGDLGPRVAREPVGEQRVPDLARDDVELLDADARLGAEERVEG